MLAEALGLRARLLGLLGERADDDWDRLLALCAAHSAPLTAMTVHLARSREGEQAPGLATDRLLAVARRRLEGRYAQAHEADRARVWPIPLHVHGAARRHRREPEAYVAAVARLAVLAWQIGDRAEGYATAWYGLRIGERLFGERAGAPLRDLLHQLCAPMSAGERAALEGAIRRKAAEGRGPPDGGIAVLAAEVPAAGDRLGRVQPSIGVGR